jgi:hypothetical protein
VLIEEGKIVAITHRDVIGDATSYRRPMDHARRRHSRTGRWSHFQRTTSEAFAAICDVNARRCPQLCATRRADAGFEAVL